VLVLQATLQMIFEHTLFDAIWASTLRILISFVAAALVALPLGIFIGRLRADQSADGAGDGAASVHADIGVIPLLILWLGIGESQKSRVSVSRSIRLSIAGRGDGDSRRAEELVQTALTLGATRGQVIRTVLVPAALPDIFDSFA